MLGGKQNHNTGQQENQERFPHQQKEGIPQRSHAAVGGTYIVGARVSLLPLNQEELGHHKCGDEDENHFGVHRLVPTVLGVHPYVLHPATSRKRQLKSTPAQSANTSGEPGRPDGKTALSIVFVNNPEGKGQKAALGPAHFLRCESQEQHFAHLSVKEVENSH